MSEEQTQRMSRERRKEASNDDSPSGKFNSILIKLNANFNRLQEKYEEAHFDSHSRISCGLDGIPGILLKRAGGVIYGFFAILFKHCIQVRGALNFLGSSCSLDNNMVDNAVTNNEDIESLHRRRHLPPAALISLMDEGLLVLYHLVFLNFI